MPPTYSLSNRQQKELANGKVLRIALPYPDAGIPGAHRHHDGEMECREDWQSVLTEWVADVLDTGGVAYDCAWVDIEEVPTQITNRTTDGLVAVLGAIYSGRGPASYIVRIVCVVVEIATRRAPRARYPTQWPGGQFASRSDP